MSNKMRGDGATPVFPLICFRTSIRFNELPPMSRRRGAAQIVDPDHALQDLSCYGFGYHGVITYSGCAGRRSDGLNEMFTHAAESVCAVPLYIVKVLVRYLRT